MDTEALLVLLILSLGLVFTFAVIYYLTRRMSTPAGEKWLEESHEFAKKHPVWNFFYTVLPFPIGLILQLIGPKPPRLPTKDKQ